MFRALVQIGAGSTSIKSEHVLSNQPEGGGDNDNNLMYDFDYDNSGGGPEGPDDEANVITMCKWKEHEFWTYLDEQLDVVCELAIKHILYKQGWDTKVTEYVSMTNLHNHCVKTPFSQTLRGSTNQDTLHHITLCDGMISYTLDQVWAGQLL